MAQLNNTKLQNYCEICNQIISKSTNKISTLTQPTQLINHLWSYLYHQNVNEALMPTPINCGLSDSDNGQGYHPELPKLSFSISFGEYNVPKADKFGNRNNEICGECVDQLEQLGKLHQQLESVKNSINSQIKLINRKRQEKSILGQSSLSISPSPGLVMAGSSIGKENISQALNFLNSICDGIKAMESSPQPTLQPCNQTENLNENQCTRTTVIRQDEIQGADANKCVVGEVQHKNILLDGLEHAVIEKEAVFKVESISSDYLEDKELDDNVDTQLVMETHATTLINDKRIPELPTYPISSSSSSAAVVIPTKPLTLNFKSVSKKKNTHYSRARKESNSRKKKCPECSKMVSTGNMAAHLRVHSGELPFVCNICGKGFSRSNTCKQHVIVAHKITKGNS